MAPREYRGSDGLAGSAIFCAGDGLLAVGGANPEAGPPRNEVARGRRGLHMGEGVCSTVAKTRCEGVLSGRLVVVGICAAPRTL